MEKIVIVLLIVIIVILAWDTFILRKIFMLGKKGETILADERYFELKYNINLLKAVATFLIFILGFFGFTTYRDFKSKIEEEIEKEIVQQKSEINLISKKLTSYYESLDSIEKYKNNVAKGISKFNNNVLIVNEKVEQIKESLKLSPRLYTIKKHEYPYGIHDNPDTVKVYFQNLLTVNEEKLPQFKTAPIVLIEGHGFGINILEVTDEYFSFDADMFYGKKNLYYYDIWIAAYE